MGRLLLVDYRRRGRRQVGGRDRRLLPQIEHNTQTAAAVQLVGRQLDHVAEERATPPPIDGAVFPCRSCDLNVRHRDQSA